MNRLLLFLLLSNYCAISAMKLRDLSSAEKEGALIAAATIDDYLMVSALCEDKQLNVNVQSAKDKWTPLMISANRNNVRIACKLLNHPRIDINKGNDAVNPLLTASIEGHAEFLKLLINSKADVHWTSEHWQGRTALMFACRNRHFPVVKLLLEAGASVNAGRTLQSFRPGPEIYFTALDEVNDTAYSSETEQERLAIIDLLKRYGAVQGIDLPD